MRRLAAYVVLLVGLAGAGAQDLPVGVVVEPSNHVETRDEALNDTDLLLAFVVFRHGDRTPDQDELDLYPSKKLDSSLFFPYGIKSLTNKGKQRGFKIGQYLRRRYDGFLSRLYLPDEIRVRTTDFSRTKMSALTALAALYPPQTAQTWNPALNWQPVPYDTLPFDDDDMLYWYNCPPYKIIRDKVYGLEEVANHIKRYEPLFKTLTGYVGYNVTKPENVFSLDNLFQTLANVGVETPEWAKQLMPEIKEVTKFEYAVEFFNDELIRLATGVIMSEIVNATSAVISGHHDQPKLRIYSSHENNVAALMAAARVFKPHQPKYGATFSLELRRHKKSGRFGFAAVYAPDIGEPEQILPVAGCGGRPLCDYDTFISLTHDTLLSREEFKKQCSIFR